MHPFIKRLSSDFGALWRYLAARRDLRRIARSRQSALVALDAAHRGVGAQAWQESLGRELPEFAVAGAQQAALTQATAQCVAVQAEYQRSEEELAARKQEHGQEIRKLEDRHTLQLAEVSRAGNELSELDRSKALAPPRTDFEALRASAVQASEAAKVAANALAAEVNQAKAEWAKIRSGCEAVLHEAQQSLDKANRAEQLAKGSWEQAQLHLGRAICMAGVKGGLVEPLLAEVAAISTGLDALSASTGQASAAAAANLPGARRAGFAVAVGIVLIVGTAIGLWWLTSGGGRRGRVIVDLEQAKSVEPERLVASADLFKKVGLTEGPMKRTPAAIPESHSKPLDVSPVPGLRLTAPANALDRDRTFQVKAVEESRKDIIRQRASGAGAMVLGSFDLDAGMTDKDVFPGEMTLSLDFEKMKVPPEFRDSVAIGRVGASGDIDLLPVRSEGSTASVQLRHNSEFVVMVILYAAWYATVSSKDDAELPKGDFVSTQWVPGDMRFCLLYPRTWPHRDPVAAQAFRDDVTRVTLKHGLDEKAVRQLLDFKPRKPATLQEQLDPFFDLRQMGSDMSEVMGRYQKLVSDPESKALEAKMRDKKWLRDIWLPVRVGHVATAMDRSYDYLVGTRGFRPPGVATCSYTINVYTVDVSLGPDIKGECRNLWTTRPFIVMDGTKIPDADESAFAVAGNPAGEGAKERFDAMQTTAVHELFHAIQSAYNFFDLRSYLWFNEATAVTLEKEAGTYFMSQGFTQSWDHTIRTYDAFPRRLDYTDNLNAVTQQHGYSAAYFVEALRDRYFSAEPLKFLPELMENFAGFGGGTLASLQRVTSNNQGMFEKDYWLFCLQHRNDIVKSVLCKTIPCSPAQPWYSWKLPKSEPLSAPGLKVKFLSEEFPAGSLKDAQLVVRDSTSRVLRTLVDWQPLTQPWESVPTGQYVAHTIPDGLASAFTVNLQRIEPYLVADPSANAAELGSTDLFLLSRPPRPQIDLRNGTLTVRIADTPLMKAPDASLSGPYLKGYEVTVSAQADPKRKMLAMGGDREGGVTTFRLKYNDIMKMVNKGSMADTPVEVSYREIANAKPELLGPPSEPLGAEIPSAAVFPACFVRMEVPFKYLISGSNKMSGQSFDEEYKFDRQMQDAAWTGRTMTTTFKASDSMEDSLTITVDKNSDKIARLTIGRKNTQPNQSGHVEFTWENIPRRYTIDFGPKGPSGYIFVVFGKDLEKLNTAAVNEASGTAQENNPQTGKAETVTFSSKLTSVDWPGSFLVVMLGTMSDNEIRALIEKKILSAEELEKKFGEQMSNFMQLIEKDVQECRRARQR